MRGYVNCPKCGKAMEIMLNRKSRKVLCRFCKHPYLAKLNRMRPDPVDNPPKAPEAAAAQKNPEKTGPEGVLPGEEFTV